MSPGEKWDPTERTEGSSSRGSPPPSAASRTCACEEPPCTGREGVTQTDAPRIGTGAALSSLPYRVCLPVTLSLHCPGPRPSLRLIPSPQGDPLAGMVYEAHAWPLPWVFTYCVQAAWTGSVHTNRSCPPLPSAAAFRRVHSQAPAQTLESRGRSPAYFLSTTPQAHSPGLSRAGRRTCSELTLRHSHRFARASREHTEAEKTSRAPGPLRGLAREGPGSTERSGPGPGSRSPAQKPPTPMNSSDGNNDDSRQCKGRTHES